MATKRKITVKIAPPDEYGEESDEKLQPIGMRRDRGWKDWFLREYLPYWYFAGCLLADTFAVLEVWTSVDSGLSISVPLIVLTALALVEILVYLTLWGKNGKWKKR